MSAAASADGSKLVASSDDSIWILQSVPTPLLSLSPSGTNLGLSWTLPSTRFVLQQNSDLTTTKWTDVANAPTINLTNLQYQVSLPIGSGGRFYRLKH